MVEASIKSDLGDSLREGTQFWLVTPKASLAGVSGLDALVGGNYIGMMPGSGKEQTHFTALDTQPKYRLNTGELMIHLHADDLGSLNSGSLVYYRKIPVGKVYDYTISEGNKGVTIDVLIDRRFAHLVKTTAASGTSPASRAISACPARRYRWRARRRWSTAPSPSILRPMASRPRATRAMPCIPIWPTASAASISCWICRAATT